MGKFMRVILGEAFLVALWNDPEIGIDWPIKNAILSEKDREARRLAEWLNTDESDFFKY